MPVVEAIKISG